MVIDKNNPELFSIISTILNNNGVVIMPCDTIYGIVGVAPDTETRIQNIKGRSPQKPFLQLIPSLKWLPKFTAMKVPEFLSCYWPGPLTLIFPGIKESTKVALRIPNDQFLCKILFFLKKSLYSTSVNKAGQSHLWQIEDIIAQFADNVDVIINAGNFKNALPSTIVDLTSKPFMLIREGELKLPPDIFTSL